MLLWLALKGFNFNSVSINFNLLIVLIIYQQIKVISVLNERVYTIDTEVKYNAHVLCGTT